jgi:uncharacterized protein
MAVVDVLSRKGLPRKLLTLDGGGIRGALTIEVLARLEELLRQRTGNAQLVLGDWFDYVAGTSTGAIIAACLAAGMSTDKLRAFYQEQGPAMFEKAFLLKRLNYEYKSEPLALTLRKTLGDNTTLGDPTLRCLLMMVMRNATTDSPWPVSNNPGAKYNDRAREDCNLNLPLWQLVRASTAAPVYFPPEYVQLGKQQFMFVDGGVTTYNNPAFLLFLMATLAPYKLCWPTGEKQMLLVSVGTGASLTTSDRRDGAPFVIENAQHIPSALMAAASVQQDLLCRSFGRCVAGDHLDRELGDLTDLATTTNPLGLPALFTYARYDVELSAAGLEKVGVTGIDPAKVSSLDSVENVADLQKIGTALAAHRVKPSLFDGFV